MVHTRSLLLFAALTLCSTACISTTTGEEGNLTFSYESRDDTVDFNKAIAVGSKLDVKIAEAGTEGDRDVTVESATSSDEEIFSVGLAGGDTITISALAEGRADIEVDAVVASSGESEFDRVSMRAAVPEVLELKNRCESDRHVYLAGSEDVLVGFDMKLEDGQQVVGYGYYPITAEPAEGVVVDSEGDSQYDIRIDLGDMAGDVAITSDVSEAMWTFELVEQGAIDGATRIGGGSTKPGGSTAFRLDPTVDNATVCQAGLTPQIDVLTPEVCDVRLLEGAGKDVQEAITGLDDWYEASGKVVGDCRFNVTYAEGAQGEGASSEIVIAIKNEE